MSAFSAMLTKPWRRPRVALGFSERMLVALPPQGGGIRRELPAGLLAPSPSALNIQSLSEVARVASDMIDELGCRGATVPIALPDLAVVSAMLPAGKTAADIGSELAPRLGFPLSEARVDFWRSGRGEVLAAAVRKTVVRQYEQVVEAAECTVGWIDGASLARIPFWAEASALEPGTTWVRAMLYRSHYVLALFREGGLLDIRTRLRSEGDVDSVVGEIRRLPAVYGLDAVRGVALSGEGASDCARLLSEAGVETQFSTENEDEERQLEASLAALRDRN